MTIKNTKKPDYYEHLTKKETADSPKCKPTQGVWGLS